jgi:hypothetical protein
MSDDETNNPNDPIITLPLGEHSCQNAHAITMRLQALYDEHCHDKPEHWRERLRGDDPAQNQWNHADGLTNVFTTLMTLALADNCPPGALMQLMVRAFGRACENNRHLPHVQNVEVEMMEMMRAPDREPPN